MKKKGMVLLAVVIVSLAATLIPSTRAAAAGWEISLSDVPVSGSFDYVLHYSATSQILSKVSLPQNQNMRLLNGKYSLSDNGYFVNVQYGWTGLGMKGRGSDSDWTTPGSNVLTDYGDMDFYGDQRVFAVDTGMNLIVTDAWRITVFTGWGIHETTNELKNVVYHLIDGSDVGDQGQADNGSTLNGEFREIRIGAAGEVFFNAQTTLVMGLTLRNVAVTAYGHWANHIPAWDWVDTGTAIGYRAEVGLKYAFWPNLQGRIGYFYQNDRADGCIEVLNGSMLNQAVDLKYEQKGFYFGLCYLF